VPAPLLAATVRTTTIYSTSTLAAAGVSPTVTGLTDGVIRMFWLKKLMTVAVTTALALGAGVLLLGTSGRSERATGATESVAASTPLGPRDESSALKRLEQRVADLEKHRALLDGARRDPKAGARKPEAVREEKKLEKPTAQELEAAINNLKQIGLAFHLYADDNDSKWADDLTDKDGHPLLSWRVALLPHLGEKDLYEQFKLDEPWDSKHNKTLIAKMPQIYAPIRVKAKEGETFYQRFVGKGALFSEKGPAYTISKLPDGTANTCLVVEAGDPATWTKPIDLPFNLKGPLPKLGGLFDGDFHTVFCDGAVHRFKKDYDADEMRNVIRPDDVCGLCSRRVFGRD
jgi:hypothetical protein